MPSGPSERRRPRSTSSACKERLRADRFARRRHAVVRLDDSGFAAAAFLDRGLANAVARHKTMVFAERAVDRSRIDDARAVNGGLQRVPAGGAAAALAEDDARTVDDGLLLEEARPFEALMVRCAAVAALADSPAEEEKWGGEAAVYISDIQARDFRRLDPLSMRDQSIDTSDIPELSDEAWRRFGGHDDLSP